MGETRVDLLHLLEDLCDAYSGSLEESILTEIVANALDSGARTLRFETNPAEATLAALDDGAGMTKRELARYHDLGASSKRRGKGIGFAGVGIKLGLLASHEVVTETRRAGVHAATSWRLLKRTRAPWSWIQPPHLLEGDGTALLLHLSSPLSQLLDRGFLEATVVRHFQAFFEPDFLDVLAQPYPSGFSILVDDHPWNRTRSSRSSGDLNLWVRPTPENAERVCNALKSFGAPLDLIDLADLTSDDLVFQIGLEPNRIDILTDIGSVQFDAAWKNRLTVELSGLEVPVIGRADLIRAKMDAGRPQDLADVAALRKAQDRL